MNAPSPLPASLLVAFGGGGGALLRYQLGRAVGRMFPAASLAFPWATLAVNVAGSLAMGVLVGWLARHGDAGPVGGAEGWRLLLGVGLLGGFTTFSSFSLEFVGLWQRGQPGLAAGYAVLSFVAGIGGLILGLALTRIAA